MERPDFIVPPPGIAPERPASGSETVRVPERRAPLPAFVPTPPGAVPAPPPAVAAEAPETAPTPVASEPEPAEPEPPAPTAPEPVATEPAATEPLEPAAPGPVAPEAAPTASEPGAPAPAPDPVPQWSLVLHDGSVIRVTGTLLIGRDPAPAPGWDHAGLLRLNDLERSVSKTHAGLDCSDGRFVVTDLGSTNGTAVIADDGSETVLQPGVATEVPGGSTVEFGRYRVRIHHT